MAGMPAIVIERASEILHQLEESHQAEELGKIQEGTAGRGAGER